MSGRRTPVLGGTRRLVFYMVLQPAFFLAPGAWLLVPAALATAAARLEGRSLLGSTLRSWPLLVIACSPALVGFPYEALASGLAGNSLAGGHAHSAAWTALWGQWLPGLLQSARLMLVFASAAWLSRGLTPIMLRDALLPLLRPLGPKASIWISRAVSLTLAFLPWTQEELKRAHEAALLRGSSPRRGLVRHLLALSVPISVRSLEKARRSAEALALRDPGLR